MAMISLSKSVTIECFIFFLRRKSLKLNCVRSGAVSNFEIFVAGKLAFVCNKTKDGAGIHQVKPYVDYEFLVVVQAMSLLEL